MKKVITMLVAVLMLAGVPVSTFAAYDPRDPKPICYVHYACSPDLPEIRNALPAKEKYGASDAITVKPSTDKIKATEVLTKDGNVYKLYVFDGWDKESAIVSADNDEGFDETTFTSTWKVAWTSTIEAYQKDIYVKFVDGDKKPITTGAFSDGVTELGQDVDFSTMYYTKTFNPPNSSAEMVTQPPVISTGLRSFLVKDGYHLSKYYKVTSASTEGYKAEEFTHKVKSARFAETETPEGFKPLGGTVEASFDLDNEKVTIVKDETKRAYVSGNTLYIVYEKETKPTAESVTALINALPEVITLDHADQVQAARDAYDALDETEKELVDFEVFDKLLDAQEAIRILKLQNGTAADVEAMINNLPDEIAYDDKDAIEAAREAYDLLSDKEKALVDPDVLQKLMDAEDALDAIIGAATEDEEAAQAVIDLIDALPSEITLADKEAVDAAKAAYMSLTDAQKDLVTNYATLMQAESVLANLEALDDEAKANAVSEQINALPGEITLDNVDAVMAAKNAYDSLTDDQKALIGYATSQKLEAAVARAEELMEAYEEDHRAASLVEDIIGSLPEVISLDAKQAVIDAKNAYEDLTDAQKNLVREEFVTKLTEAEKQIAELEATDQDKTAANNVAKLIEALPEKITLSDKDAVDAAKKAYDSLTDVQKALIGDMKAKLDEAVKVVEGLEKEMAVLKAAKDAAISELDKIDVSVYSEPELGEVKQIIASTKTNLYKATTLAEVDALMAEAKTKIKAKKTDAEKQQDGISAQQIGNAITSSSSNKDLKGATYMPLKLMQKKATSKSITIKWSKVSGAEKYTVYGAQCGKKYVKIATVNKGSLKVTKIGSKKLAKNKCYKFIVVAEKADKAVAISKTVHIKTGNNIAKLRAVKKPSRMKVGGTFKLKVTPKSGHIKIRYESGNKEIVSVNSKGQIKALSAGKTKIYCYAANGRFTAVTVTVK